MGLKVHLYHIEKDEMEKKDPEVKARKTSRYKHYGACLHWGTMEC